MSERKHLIEKYTVRSIRINLIGTKTLVIINTKRVFVFFVWYKAGTFELGGWKSVTNACHWVHTVGESEFGIPRARTTV